MPLEKPIRINPFLLPFSFLYGLGVRFRNQLFDWGILRSEQYPIPVVCIGNLSVGGTGKTPHTEYLIRLLSGKYRTAVLSRGYKRKTSGYLLATPQSSAEEIGDEPFQMKQKFPGLTVVVDENRKTGIRRLMDLPEQERPQLILLDDAYQHRHVTPSFSILLTDYNRRYYFDRLLPMGRLREPKCGRNRANIIIVTKCNPDMRPIEYRVVESEINIMSHQNLFFTGIKYGDIAPVFNAGSSSVPPDSLKSKHVLLVSGIASPEPFINEVKRQTEHVCTLNFPDHHVFKRNDIKKIKDWFDRLPSEKLILVTEKDAARLKAYPDLPDDLKEQIYYLPIEVDFRLNQEETFKDIIINHVDSFERNRILMQYQ